MEIYLQPSGDKGTGFFAIRFAAKLFLATFLIASCTMALHAQTIQIKLVDGKTGRPAAGACVGAWMKDASNKLSIFIPASKDGVARLRITQKDSEVDLSYDPKLGCGGTGAINPVLKYHDTLTTYTAGDHPSCAFPETMLNGRFNEMDFPTKEVLLHGVVSANTCGKATASPHPGDVILFVRPRNFRERLHDWKASEAFPL